MTDEAPAQSRAPELEDRAALRTLRERRRRVWRSMAGVLVITLGMLVLLVINRDNQAIRSCRSRMEFARAELQRLHDDGSLPPRVLPWPAPVEGVRGQSRARVTASGHVHYDPFHSTRFGAASRVGVCCCKKPHTRLFFSDGRHVVIYDVQQGQYELQWMDEARFAQEAEGLGLRVPEAQ